MQTPWYSCYAAIDTTKAVVLQFGRNPIGMQCVTGVKFGWHISFAGVVVTAYLPTSRPL